MRSGSGGVRIRQYRFIVFTGLALWLSACEALPVFDQQSVSDAAEPELLVELRRARADCKTQLSAALESRDDFTGLLTAQNATLADIQGMMRHLESRLSEPDGEVVESRPDPACEPQAVEQPSKLVVGRRETVWIEPLQMLLPARIDTGAETASLDARNIEEFERNGKPWVRFDIVHPATGEAVNVQREVVRSVRILQSSADKPERRVVIELGIVIGDIRQQAEFTLSNRSHLDFQVLVGRNILRDLMIVDVGQSNIAPPELPAVDGGKVVDEP